MSNGGIGPDVYSRSISGWRTQNRVCAPNHVVILQLYTQSKSYPPAPTPHSRAAWLKLLIHLAVAGYSGTVGAVPFPWQRAMSLSGWATAAEDDSPSEPSPERGAGIDTWASVAVEPSPDVASWGAVADAAADGDRTSDTPSGETTNVEELDIVPAPGIPRLGVPDEQVDVYDHQLQPGEYTRAGVNAGGQIPLYRLLRPVFLTLQRARGLPIPALQAIEPPLALHDAGPDVGDDPAASDAADDGFDSAGEADDEALGLIAPVLPVRDAQQRQKLVGLAMEQEAAIAQASGPRRLGLSCSDKVFVQRINSLATRVSGDTKLF